MKTKTRQQHQPAFKAKQSLLLADRLYGAGKFLVAFLSRFAEGGSDFLVRVSTQPKGKLSERLADGSVIVVVSGRDEQGQSGRFWCVRSAAR
jgi:hypothetical protein